MYCEHRGLTPGACCVGYLPPDFRNDINRLINLYIIFMQCGKCYHEEVFTYMLQEYISMIVVIMPQISEQSLGNCIEWWLILKQNIYMQLKKSYITQAIYVYNYCLNITVYKSNRYINGQSQIFRNSAIN